MIAKVFESTEDYNSTGWDTALRRSGGRVTWQTKCWPGWPRVVNRSFSGFAPSRYIAFGVRPHLPQAWMMNRPHLSVDRLCLLAERYWNYNQAAMPLEVQILARRRRASSGLEFAVANFQDICRWKSRRRFDRVQANVPEKVRQVISKALSAAGCCQHEAILLLTQLSGVRVKMASAILHFAVADPMSLIPPALPILDVNLLAAWGEPDRNDDLGHLQVWADFHRSMVAWSLDIGMPMRILDRALWTYGSDLLRNLRLFPL
jgi:hypothetical protein